MPRSMTDEWCKDCIRNNCMQTVEECKKTPEITTEEIYNTLVKYGTMLATGKVKINSEECYKYAQ